jgi:hypothetical protein
VLPLATGNPLRGIVNPTHPPDPHQGHIMNTSTLHRAIAAAAAAAVTLGIFSSVVSIAADDQAELAAARNVPALVASVAPDTTKR